MPEVTVQLVNAFTDNGAGGNGAGVVLEADSLSRSARQQIAAEVGLSETAFVSESRAADFKLEFFTPTRQIAHCGHATIATFSLLHQLGKLPGPETSKETIDGTRAIVMRDGAPYMEQSAPRFRTLEEPIAGVTVAGVLASLGLEQDDLTPGLVPVAVNTGNEYMIVPVRDEQTLRSLWPDFDAVGQISEALDLIGYYLFTPETQVEGRDAAARMFAPHYGINEEAATGTAAGPLAAYLYTYLPPRKTTYVIEQGRLMPSPSPSELRVDLTVEGDRIARVLVGGRAHVTGSRVVRVP